MLSFGFRAKTKDGKTITDRINAHTVTEAWSLLEQQGYQEIELLDDENSAIKLNNDASMRRLVFSAQEEQTLRQQPSIFSKTVWLFFRSRNVMIWLPLLIWLVYNIESDAERADIVLVIDLLVVYLLWFVWANIPSVMYDRALHACAWCRWREAEQWMRRLQTWKARFKIPFPEHELLFRLATAEAGQGRLSEGLQRVACLKTDTSLAAGFYDSRLASLYLVSKDFQQAAQCQREAYQLNPSASTAIDLAITLARWLKDYSAAQVLMDEVDEHKIPEMVKIFAYYCRAIIALETEQPQQACQHLESFFVLERVYKGSPLLQGLFLDAHAHYALALVASGKADMAEKHFQIAQPMLIARDDTELMARCDKARKNRA